MKRLFDIFLALVALVLLFPVMLLVVLLIKLDGGPIFFKQDRVGLHGTIFRIYKFRSMVVNASSLGGYSTIKGDPRITRVGSWIRRTSLDELPQLINVIWGNMSVVGPRPNVLAQKKDYRDNDWQKRNSVKPGITGLAQATKRSECSFEERLSLDLEYVEHVSMVLDIKIILLTIKQVLGRGGY